MSFKNYRQQKAAFANMNSKLTLNTKHKPEWNEQKYIRTDEAPIHQETALKLKKPSNEILIDRIFPQDYVSCINVGKKTLPFLSTSIIGVPISTTVANAAFSAFEDSYKSYKQTNNIDDALFIGMNSFINNYANSLTFEYLLNNLPEKNDNDIFDEVLNGIILLSSIVTDSFIEI